uniref:Uncharacterized protein n=1 Tax=Anguilla anguilla TaxID=7936 RepID=A0A0E9V875_ANGAN
MFYPLKFATDQHGLYNINIFLLVQDKRMGKFNPSITEVAASSSS